MNSNNKKQLQKHIFVIIDIENEESELILKIE